MENGRSSGGGHWNSSTSNSLWGLNTGSSSSSNWGSTPSNTTLHSSASLYNSSSASGTHQMTCVKLGKRPFYNDAKESGSGNGGDAAQQVMGSARKRERPPAKVSAAVPRCQVDWCRVALTGAKDYHRRHKVCEMHSKAPKVLVLSVEQRFCQQCSRFHEIAEFDDAKRSCRRRLAGHNERRRKNNASEAAAAAAGSSGGLPNGTLLDHGFPYLPASQARALSLLSTRASPWPPTTTNLSSRPGAALDELIAENRATLLAWQLLSLRGDWASVALNPHSEIASWSHQILPSSQPTGVPNGLGHFHEHGGHVTLDLMQAPDSSLRAESRRSKSDKEDDPSEIWKFMDA